MAETSSDAAAHVIGKPAPASSDLGVLDDLLDDVDVADAANGGDRAADAFFDTYGLGADGGDGGDGSDGGDGGDGGKGNDDDADVFADDILGQLDSITTLDDDILEGEDEKINSNISDMSLSLPLSSQIDADKGEEIGAYSSLVDSAELAATHVLDTKADSPELTPTRQENDRAEPLAPPSGEDVMNAVLDFALEADDELDDGEQEAGNTTPSLLADAAKYPTTDSSRVEAKTETSPESRAGTLVSCGFTGPVITADSEDEICAEENLDDGNGNIEEPAVDVDDEIPLDNLSQSGDEELVEVPVIESEGPGEEAEPIDIDDETIEVERQQLDGDVDSLSSEAVIASHTTEEETPDAKIGGEEATEARGDMANIPSLGDSDIVQVKRESLKDRTNEDMMFCGFGAEINDTSISGGVPSDATIGAPSARLAVEDGKTASLATEYDRERTADRTVDTQFVQEEAEMLNELPSSFGTDEEMALSVVTGPVPPPAPPNAPAVFGSMNPTDDNDDSDDSVAEEEKAQAGDTLLPPPLHIGEDDDDSDEELEVDAAVVSSLELEQSQRMSLRASLSKKGSDLSTKISSDSADGDNSLLKALPGGKAGGPDTVELTFEEEVRVAHTVAPTPGDTFANLDKVVNKDSSDLTFGISYQNTLKRYENPLDGDDGTREGSYSLPRGPAFPDEREFEKEMELESDLNFSVASAARASDSTEKGDADAAIGGDDDEFDFDVEPTADSSSMSEDALRARLESYEAYKREEEETLVRELKRATDEEKRLIEREKALEESGGTAELGTTEDHAGPTSPADADAISLTELHSMYKRGLGDQGVLMDDEEPKEKNEHEESTAPARGLSVMGRILSKSYGLTGAIAEESENNGEVDEDDGGDSDENVETDVEDVVAGEVGRNGLDGPMDSTSSKPSTSQKPAESSVDEWKEIELVQHVVKRTVNHEGSALSQATLGIANQEDLQVSWISYADAAECFTQSNEVMQHKDKIVVEEFRRGSCFSCFSRPRLTFAGALEERDRVFCIAATNFDPKSTVATSMLQTIYCKLTKTQRDVSLIGRHWEDIGFQGMDPSTDLRGCGVLSLLQMVYLVETHPELTRRFHQLSQHPTRHFPLACMLINVTLQCIGALRTGALYPECNHHSNVFIGMNRLYIALSSKLHTEIHSSSEEIPNIMKEVLDRGRAHPGKVIEEVFDGPTPRLSTLTATAPSAVRKANERKSSERKASEEHLEFTEIGLHSVDDD